MFKSSSNFCEVKRKYLNKYERRINDKKAYLKANFISLSSSLAFWLQINLQGGLIGFSQIIYVDMKNEITQNIT